VLASARAAAQASDVRTIALTQVVRQYRDEVRARADVEAAPSARRHADTGRSDAAQDETQDAPDRVHLALRQSTPRPDDFRSHQGRAVVLPPQTSIQDHTSKGLSGGGARAPLSQVLATWSRSEVPDNGRPAGAGSHLPTPDLSEEPLAGDEADTAPNAEILERRDSGAPDTRPLGRSEAPPTAGDEERAGLLLDAPALLLESLNDDAFGPSMDIRGFLQGVEDLAGQLVGSRTALVVTPVVTTALAAALYGVHYRRQKGAPRSVLLGHPCPDGGVYLPGSSTISVMDQA